VPLALLLASVAVFASPATPRQLATQEAPFRPFAQDVVTEVNRRLALPPDDRPPAALALLLAIQVHCAIHRGDSAAALAAAEKIRALQPTPDQQAYAGVTTQALVAADEPARHDRGSPAYVARFQREFAHQLAELPATAAMRRVLEDQRDKTRAMTADGLLQDLVTKVPPRAAGEGYRLEEADQIIRAHHKLADILPLKKAMLAGLDAAIAARPSD